MSIEGDHAEVGAWDYDNNAGGAPQFRSGLYKISVTTAPQTAYFLIDYRKCWGAGGPGDTHVTYNYQQDKFYKDGFNITGQVVDPPNEGIGTSCLKTPITVQNDFGGGTVSVGGQSYSSPRVDTFFVGVERNIAAISPQTIGGWSYCFSSWSDNCSQASRDVTLTVEQGKTTYTTNFTQLPAPPWGLTASCGLPHKIELTWYVDPPSDDYECYVYRRPAGGTTWELVTSVEGNPEGEFYYEDYPPQNFAIANLYWYCVTVYVPSPCDCEGASSDSAQGQILCEWWCLGSAENGLCGVAFIVS